ncbi:MAG: nucleotide pyrophosphohydrolase [Nitrospirae bacterium]|nr:MAG: nucleotide pyrophosphohydrolase [Nitrospirota bacterium]
MDLQKIGERLQAFADEREWDKFHSPKNLVMALVSEVGELVEIFQWLTEKESEDIRDNKKMLQKVEEEIADIEIYLIRLSQKLGIDIEKAVLEKIEKNAIKYPVHLSKGSAKKYTEFNT